MFTRHLFSQRVGYAMHVLCLMARRQPLAMITVSELAVKMARTWPNTSSSYLSKVVQALVQSGILLSRRGRGGGCCLARSPALVSLLEIIAALDGRPQPYCPLIPSGRCSFQDRCVNYHTLVRLQTETSEFLARVSIERLASNMPSADATAIVATPLQPVFELTKKLSIPTNVLTPKLTCPIPASEFDSSPHSPCGLSVFSG